MADPISKPAGFGDAALASKVISEYADGREGLTQEECVDTGIEEDRCVLLREVLGKGKEGAVTEKERLRLEESGFSHEFIRRLSGAEGNNAVHERAKWLSDRCERWASYPKKQLARVHMIEELEDMGGVAVTAIPALIKALGDEDRNVSHAASCALGTMGPSAVMPLIEKLEDESESVRYNATLSLMFLGPQAEPAVRKLAKLLKDKNPDVRAVAAAALRNIGKASRAVVAELAEALADEYIDVRKFTAEALARLGPAAKAAVPALIEALKDKDNYVRWAAASALGKIGPAAKEAAPALIRCLVFYKSATASEALKKIGHPAGNININTSDSELLIQVGKLGEDALPALVELLKGSKYYVWWADAAEALGYAGKPALPFLIEALKNDTPDDLLKSIAWALGRIGPESAAAAPLLLSKLRSCYNSECEDLILSEISRILPSSSRGSFLAGALKDKDSSVRRGAAKAMGKIGAPVYAVPALIRALDDNDSDVRREAASSLGEIAAFAGTAVPALTRVLGDENRGVRYAAAYTLGDIGPSASPAVPRLIEMLREEEWQLRHAVVTALGKIGPGAKHAVPTLERVRDNDPDRYCREAAGEAIEKIAGD